MLPDPPAQRERSKPRVAAVLLAGGESRRMGGIDKRLLTIDGQPLLRRWMPVFRDAGIDDVVVVLGHDADRLEALLADASVRLVRNPRWSEGQQTSVLAGLAALPSGADAVMIVLCDLPLVDAADLALLRERYASRAQGVEVIVPVHRGQRGNPVLVAAAVVAAVLADPQGEGLRAYIDRHPAAVDRFQVDSDHFAFDLDTPQDIDRLELRLGRPVGARTPRPAS